MYHIKNSNVGYFFKTSCLLEIGTAVKCYDERCMIRVMPTTFSDGLLTIFQTRS